MWSARPHEKAIQPERYRMSIGCPSRSLPPLFLSLYFFYFHSFSLSLVFRWYVSVHLATLSHLLTAPFTRDPDFVRRLSPPRLICYPCFSIRFFGVSLPLFLIFSLVIFVCCSPSVFNIDYEMTIDLPDCAWDRCVPEFTGNKQQSGRMVDQERQRKRERGRREGGREGGRDGRTIDGKKRIKSEVSSYSRTVGPAMWRDLPKSFRYSSTSLSPALPQPPPRRRSQIQSPADLSLNSAKILWDFSFVTEAFCFYIPNVRPLRTMME